MKLSPRIIPGGLHTLNKSACDWGWQGYLAYGCHNFVVVLDPRTVQVVQTVHNFPSVIVKVRWANENYHHDMQSGYTLKLAAADQAGHVMIWDIAHGKLLNDFGEVGKPITEMHWLKYGDASNNLLMILHSPGNLILWNADTGLKMWRKNFNDPLVSFALDPFNDQTIAVMSQEWIMFLSDFTTTTPPSDKGKKFHITSNAGGPSGGNSGMQSALNASNKSASSKSAFAKMRSWAGDMRGRSDEECSLSSECLQFSYLPNNKNHFLLLFSREILILDLEFGQAIGSYSIENNSPSFVQVIPCRQRDALFCLHDNGSITLKLRRSPCSIPYRQDDNPDSLLSNRIVADILYDPKCHSDVFRLSRLCRIMGFCLDSVNEKQMIIILSDGRVLFWNLIAEPMIKQIAEDDDQHNNQKLNLAEIIPPLVTFSENRVLRPIPKIRFLLNGMFEGVSSNPTCMKMCPALTTKNWAVYKPFAAVGCSSGLLQIFNLADGSLYREISVHATAVKGIEWFNLSTLLSFAHSSSNTAKSEIHMIDVRTGQNCALPTSRGLQESHVACIRISHQRQYVLILFKNHHAELWDAVTLSQLREFPGNFPSITAVEWSPLHYSTKLRKKYAQKPEALPSFPGSDTTGIVLENNSQSESKTVYTKEHLVFTNAEGIVYHYVIEGTSMKDGSKVPPESGMSAVTYITWKSDLLVLGDVDGNINLWDLKGKLSRVFPSNRGAVRRLKFAPGKGNMKLMVLFADGIDIWETQEAIISLSLKTTKDQPSVTDADWLSSDMPLLLLSDGSVRALDSTVKTSNSAILDRDIEEPIFSPRILPTKVSLSLKYILQHQPWNSSYSLDFEDHKGNEYMEQLKVPLENIPSEFLWRLRNSKFGTAERCTIVSQIFGDESEFIFWSIALHYLKKERNKRLCPLHKDQDISSNRRSSFKDVIFSDGTQGILRTDSQPKNMLLDLIEDGSECTEGKPLDPSQCVCYKETLDSCFDIMCDNDFYQNLQLYRIALRDSRRSTPEHTRTCAEKLILIGETDRAVQILLEADPNEQSYYSDALRACLIATVRSSGASQSTIKLVATNLIANGKLSEGVELLCLVDKGVEACRYLQTYGNWDLANWLAKVSLNQQDFVNVMSRWVDHLSSSHVNQKNKAILILLSLGDFTRALEIMFGLGQIGRAVLFLESCLEFNLLAVNDERHVNLFENIFLEYARQMQKLGFHKAVGYYCSKAGGRGRKLLEELSSSADSINTEKDNETEDNEQTNVDEVKGINTD